MFFRAIRKDCDIIHAYIPVPIFADLGALAAKIKRVPFVLSPRAEFELEGPLKILTDVWNSTVEKITYHLADKVVVQNDYMENYTRKRFGVKDEMGKIINGIDINIPKGGKVAERKRWGFKPDEKIILFVEVLDVHKGTDILINAFAKVRKNIKGARLVIAGDGCDRKRLEEEVNKLGIKDEVLFLGMVHHDFIGSLMVTSDIVCVPSFRESCPRSALEAMACGRPVIASNVGGIPEIIRDGKTGLLVEPRNVDELSRAIKKIILNKKLQDKMGDAAREWSKRFSWDLVSESYLKIYKDLLRE